MHPINHFDQSQILPPNLTRFHLHFDVLGFNQSHGHHQRKLRVKVDGLHRDDVLPVFDGRDHQQDQEDATTSGSSGSDAGLLCVGLCFCCFDV
jgi:hypothetical protein